MHYDALMAQINPHFLYNSLNSIKWIASLGGNNLAADMLSKLGSILHYYFGKEGDTILLSEELDFLEKYVDMLGIRYGNLFEYIVDIPQDLQLLNIPRFCLQPIIENSIMHGILSVTGGRVKIIANKHLDCLQIIVSDNGIGMEQEKANLLLSGETSKKHFDGIGINNVNLRIQLLYGAPFGLKIISSLSKGVTVIVKLPVLEIKTDEKSLDS